MKREKIKCVVWDLDNTLWYGVLTEDYNVHLNENAVEVIKELDRRGILQSISSKNDFKVAKDKLEELGIMEYFIYPQINWNSKSDAISEIAKSINIGINTLAFIDDQEFEREEVKYYHPEVLCIDALDIDKVLEMEEMKPKFITSDSKNRRAMYQNDIKRNSVEKDFQGTKEEFLETLDMKLTISRAQIGDLQRMEELTVRTHQLNSTGSVYSYDELKNFIELDEYEVLVVELDDKFGTYGKIGVALIEKQGKIWELKLLLMSCRVMAKGVGNVFMNDIINKAKANNAILRAQFIPTDRNRIMYITYKFNGFKEVETRDSLILLEADMSYERMIPKYVTLLSQWG